VNLWSAPNLLLQKFPAPEFTVTTKISFHPESFDEKSGLIVTGVDYAYLALQKSDQGLSLIQVTCSNADNRGEEKIMDQLTTDARTLLLQVKVTKKAVCRFCYSFDGVAFHQIGKPSPAKPGKWIGAKVGLFAINSDSSRAGGFADYEFFRVE